MKPLQPQKRHLYQCDCHDFHFLAFEWWPDEPDSEVCVSAYVILGGADWNSWKKRFKAAWNALRGKEYSVYECVLNTKDAKDLLFQLNDFIFDAGEQVAVEPPKGQ